MSEQTLADVKPGDRVLYLCRLSANDGQILTVDRVTATQIAAAGQRFKKDNGRQIGGCSAWYDPRIVFPVTEAHLAGQHREYLYKSIRDDKRLRTLPLDKLQQIQAWLDEMEVVT